MTGDEVAEQVAAHRDRHPGDRPVVLDRDRNAGERPLVARADLRRSGERRVVSDVRERTDRRLECVNPREAVGDELGGGDLSGSDELGELERRSEHELGHGQEAYAS